MNDYYLKLLFFRLFHGARLVDSTGVEKVIHEKKSGKIRLPRVCTRTGKDHS